MSMNELMKKGIDTKRPSSYEQGIISRSKIQFINDKIISARNGNSEAIQELKRHYVNIHCNKVENQEELEVLISEIIDKYFDNQLILKLDRYVREKLLENIKDGKVVRKEPRELIRTLDEKSKQGDIEAQEKLIKHYQEYYKHYVKRNSHIENIEEKLNKFIEDLIREHIKKGNVLPEGNKLDCFLRRAEKNAEFDYEKYRLIREHPVEKMSIQYKNRDESVKTQIVKKYMHWIDEIKDLDEDEKQEGYKILIEYVNSYRDNNIVYFSHFKARVIERVKRKVVQMRNENSKYVCQPEVHLQDDCFEEQQFDFETVDYLKRKGLSDYEIGIYAKLSEGSTYDEIGSVYGKTREAIRQKRKKLQKDITPFMKI